MFSSEHKDHSEKKNRDNERLKHTDSSSEKHREKHKEKDKDKERRREEKVGTGFSYTALKFTESVFIDA